MEFEEMSDMACIAARKKYNLNGISERKKIVSYLNKKIKNLSDEKNKGEIAECIVLLMFLANNYHVNLEDSMLNKIEGMYKK